MEGSRVCLNKFCRIRSSVPARRKGWRLRSGDLADLCDNCGTLYEQGTLCEAFHSDSDGWRKCQTCGKRVHCGCIVSRSMFVLLDGGGVECLLCVQNKSTTGTNRPWSSTLILSPSSGGLNDLPLKNWSQRTATNTFSGHLRQSPNTWSSTVAAQSNLHKQLSFEFDRHNSIDRSTSNARPPFPERPTTNTLQERSAFSGLRRIPLDSNSRIKVPGFSGFQAEVSIDRPQESGLLMVDDHHVATRKGVILGSRLSSCAGIKLEKVPGSHVTAPLQATVPKQETTAAVICVSTCPALLEEKNPARLSTNQAYHPTPPNSLQKQLSHNPNSQMEANGESQFQIHNGRPPMEVREKSQLLPQFLPKKTNEELQIISGNSNTVTLLFEKVLSASDAGRIGRLVLPKKCAEAYFPAISLPEGLPLKVQDITGKEWVFQFRFWPNNNSRMYVLEGVTPCLQSLQLQAGDTVTFTRIDPEGKLVMGFRKSSNSQSEQAHKSENGLSSTSEVNNRNSNQSELMPSRHCQLKDSCQFPFNQPDGVDCPKMDKPELVQNEKPASKSFVLSTKRKCNNVWSKSKRMQIKSEDSIELKLTWEEAQELLRPPPNYCPSIVLIEGHEFEEYEEAPVLAKPTLFTANQDGTSGKVQWAQCEDCSKWRKLPEDALLPSRWTCSDNIWDSNRSSCLSPQDICSELAELQISNYSATSKKSKSKIETGATEESDRLETLDNNANLGEGDSSLHPSQPTTKHPRHRPGCSCVICIQPPSGTGPKHKQGCCCNVCVMVQRRLHTMMVNKVKKQAAMEAEAAQRKQLQSQQPELLLQEVGGHDASSNKGVPMRTISAYDDALSEEDTDKRKELSPAKTKIDLNMQPEREEDTSPPISNIDCFVSHTQNATQ